MMHQLTYYTVVTILLTTTMNMIQQQGGNGSAGGMVAAERMIRFAFNNGHAPSQYTACSDSDFQRYIDPIFSKIDLSTTITDIVNATSTTIQNIANGNVRARRQLTVQRATKTYSAKCKNYCAGMAKGTCRATNCVGYRRRDRQYRSLESEENDANEDEDEDDDSVGDDQPHYRMTCAEQINDIHAALDKLISTTQYSSYYGSYAFSSSCKRFIAKSKRKAECYDDIVYGEVNSFTFWNMKGTATSSKRYSSSYSTYQNRIKIKENVTADGFNVCDNIPLNIEANINECVKVVRFKLQGWGKNTNSTSDDDDTEILLMKYGRIDEERPMFLFNVSVNAATYGGRYLVPGSYTMTVTPDQFRYKQKTLQFNVIHC